MGLKEKLTRAKGMRTDTGRDREEKTNFHFSLFLNTKVYTKQHIPSQPALIIGNVYAVVAKKERNILSLQHPELTAPGWRGKFCNNSFIFFLCLMYFAIMLSLFFQGLNEVAVISTISKKVIIGVSSHSQTK